MDGARAFETPHIAIADELGAAFLCADLGITSEPRADHAQYLDHWLGVMKADKKAIFAGASKASEAAAFLAALQSGCVSTVPATSSRLRTSGPTLWIQEFEYFRPSQAVQYWECHFRVGANCGRFRWLGWRAPVSACYRPIFVSAWRRPVRFFGLTPSILVRIQIPRPGILPISPHIFGFGNRWNSHRISVG